MHLDARNPNDYEEVMKVKAVYVNNKKVAMPVAFDTKEGWCDCYIPDVSADGLASTRVSEEGETELVVKRLTGVITVEFKDQ